MENKTTALQKHSELSLTLTMLLCLCLCQANTKLGLHPVILVPGNGGNQLEARLTSEYRSSDLLCGRWNPIKKDRHGWFRLWFDISVLFSPFTKCFAQRMMLYYDEDLDDYFNAHGVETRVPQFGSTQSLLYLDPNLKKVTTYMAPLVESLEQMGYTNGETLFGAPYDFRYGLAAKGHPCRVGSKFLQDLKSLIEKASHSNGGKPVIVVSHSLGGLLVLHLLNQNPPSWSHKFVKHFISLSAPWGGTVDMMLTFGSGNTLGVPLVDPLMVRAEQRSSESNLWLMPSPKVFNPSKPLVITPNATYTSSTIHQFLDDIGLHERVEPYKSRILPLVEELAAPDVPVTCIIGCGVSTPETVSYGEKGFDEQPEVVYGDGDGTVNNLSLLALENMWSTAEKKQPLKVIRVKGVSHTQLLTKSVAIDKIIGEIAGINLDQNDFGFSGEE